MVVDLIKKIPKIPQFNLNFDTHLGMTTRSYWNLAYWLVRISLQRQIAIICINDCVAIGIYKIQNINFQKQFWGYKNVEFGAKFCPLLVVSFCVAKWVNFPKYIKSFCDAYLTHNITLSYFNFLNSSLSADNVGIWFTQIKSFKKFFLYTKSLHQLVENFSRCSFIIFYFT